MSAKLATTDGSITRERVEQLFSYSPEDGLFRWKIRTHGRGGMKNPGDTAGSIGHSYIIIRIDGTLYRAHRLAFLCMTGKWPAEDVDHVNGVKTEEVCTTKDGVPGADEAMKALRALGTSMAKLTDSLGFMKQVRAQDTWSEE